MFKLYFVAHSLVSCNSPLLVLFGNLRTWAKQRSLIGVCVKVLFLLCKAVLMYKASFFASFSYTQALWCADAYFTYLWVNTFLLYIFQLCRNHIKTRNTSHLNLFLLLHLDIWPKRAIRGRALLALGTNLKKKNTINMTSWVHVFPPRSITL